jgi:hypothetical protein
MGEELAERKWQRTMFEGDYEAYREARNKKGRHIRKALRNTHRQQAEEASTSESGQWKLVKWARNRHNATPTCTPALQKPSGGFTTQAKKKAETLRHSFFPPPLMGTCTLHRSNVMRSHLRKSNAVRRAAPNKALGTDEITNGILLPYLHKLFNACLQL